MSKQLDTNDLVKAVASAVERNDVAGLMEFARQITERSDSWTSVFADVQQSFRDRASGLRWSPRDRLSDAALEGLYEQNAMAARIVDKIVDDSLREGWDLKLASEEDATKAKALLEDLAFDPTLVQAFKWGRLYGGALLCAATTDYDPDTGEVRKPHEPMGKVAAVYRPFVIPRQDADPIAWDTTFGSPTYHKVLQYYVRNESGRQITLHHSRCFVIEPIPMALTASRSRGNYWGPSVLERPYESIARYGAALQHGTSMMYVASILFMLLEHYREDYMSKGGPERLRLRLQEMFRTIDSRGALVMDKMDQIGSTTLSMSGVTDVIDANRDAFAADSGMPKEIALNESPAGLNAGQLSGPQELWFGQCQSFRQHDVTPAIDWFLNIFEQIEPSVKEREIDYSPLWVKSDQEKATTAATWATSDKAYFDMGADGAAIVKARLVDGVTGLLELPDETAVGVPLDVTGEEVAASTAAAAAPGPDAPTPAEEALSGVQITSLGAVQKDFNQNLITYTQAKGTIALAFPKMRGREVEVLGPSPPQPDILGGGLVAVAPAPVAGAAPTVETDEPDPLAGPSDDPIPDDVVSPREAAAKFRVHTRTITRLMEKKNADGTPVIRFWGFGGHKQVSLADIVKAARSHEMPEDESEDPDGT